MTQFSLKPGFVKLFYTANGHQHIATIPARPEAEYEPGDPVNLLNAVGAAVAFATAVGSLVAAVTPFYSTSSSFDRAEFWRVDDNQEDPLFIRSTTFVGAVGESTEPAEPYGQAVFTWRTYGGHLMRQYFMESVLDLNQVITASELEGGVTADFSTYMSSEDPFMVGRDGTPPFTYIRGVTKVSDPLRKRYLLG